MAMILDPSPSGWIHMGIRLTARLSEPVARWTTGPPAAKGQAVVGGGGAAPVMIATASDLECDSGVITVARRPSLWMWMRSATSKTWGMLWLIRMMARPRRRS